MQLRDGTRSHTVSFISYQERSKGGVHRLAFQCPLTFLLRLVSSPSAFLSLMNVWDSNVTKQEKNGCRLYDLGIVNSQTEVAFILRGRCFKENKCLATVWFVAVKYDSIKHTCYTFTCKRWLESIYNPLFFLGSCQSQCCCVWFSDYCRFVFYVIYQKSNSAYALITCTHLGVYLYGWCGFLGCLDHKGS